MNLISSDLKLRENKKWKNRFCLLQLRDQLRDNVAIVMYKNQKSFKKGLHPRQTISLDVYYGVESGFVYDRESYTLAILLAGEPLILAFSTQDALIEWEFHLRKSLGQSTQFRVEIVQAPCGSLIPEGSKARLHVHDLQFCLACDSPPRICGQWKFEQLRRYGALHNKFCFELGTRAGRGAGMFVLLSSQNDQIAAAFSLASKSILHSKLTENSRLPLVADTDATVSDLMNPCRDQPRRMPTFSGSSGVSENRPLLPSLTSSSSLGRHSDSENNYRAEYHDNEVFESDFYGNHSLSGSGGTLPDSFSTVPRSTPKKSVGHDIGFTPVRGKIHEQPIGVGGIHCRSQTVPFSFIHQSLNTSSALSKCSAEIMRTRHSSITEEKQQSVDHFRDLFNLPYNYRSGYSDFYSHPSHVVSPSVSVSKFEHGGIPMPLSTAGSFSKPNNVGDMIPSNSSMTSSASFMPRSSAFPPAGKSVGGINTLSKQQELPGTCACHTNNYMNQDFIDSLQHYYNIDKVVLSVSRKTRCCDHTCVKSPASLDEILGSRPPQIELVINDASTQPSMEENEVPPGFGYVPMMPSSNFVPRDPTDPVTNESSMKSTRALSEDSMETKYVASENREFTIYGVFLTGDKKSSKNECLPGGRDIPSFTAPQLPSAGSFIDRNLSGDSQKSKRSWSTPATSATMSFRFPPSASSLHYLELGRSDGGSSGLTTPRTPTAPPPTPVGSAGRPQTSVNYIDVDAVATAAVKKASQDRKMEREREVRQPVCSRSVSVSSLSPTESKASVAASYTPDLSPSKRFRKRFAASILDRKKNRPLLRRSSLSSLT